MRGNKRVPQNVDRTYEKTKFEPHIVINLRRELNEEKANREKAEKKINEIKKHVKVTKLNEIEIEMAHYIEECKRLSSMIGDDGAVQKNDDIVYNLQHKCKALEEKLKGKMAESSSLQSEIVRRNNEIKKLSEKCNDPAKNTDKKDTFDKEKQFRELQNRLVSLEKDLNSAKQNYEKAKIELSKKEQEILQIKSQNKKSIESKHDQIEEENVDTENSVKLLKQQLKEKEQFIEQQKKTQSDNIDRLNQQISNITKQYDSSQQAISQLQKQISSDESGLPIVRKELLHHLTTIIKIILQINNCPYNNCQTFIQCSPYTIHNLMEQFKSKFKFDENSSKLLARCLVEDDIEGKGKVQYDPSKSIPNEVYSKRFTKLLGKYTLYTNDDQAKYLKHIHKRYQQIPEGLDARLKSNDVNNDGVLGTAKIMRLLKKYTEYSKEERGFLVYYAIKHFPDNPNLCHYSAIVKTILNQPNEEQIEKKVEVKESITSEKDKIIDYNTVEKEMQANTNIASINEENKHTEKSKGKNQNQNIEENNKVDEPIVKTEDGQEQNDNPYDQEEFDNEPKSDQPSKSKEIPKLEFDIKSFFKIIKNILKEKGTTLEALIQNDMAQSNGINQLPSNVLISIITDLGFGENVEDVTSLLAINGNSKLLRYDDIIAMARSSKEIEIEDELSIALHQYISTCQLTVAEIMRKMEQTSKDISVLKGVKVKQVKGIEADLFTQLFNESSISLPAIDVLLTEDKKYVLLWRLQKALEIADKNKLGYILSVTSDKIKAQVTDKLLQEVDEFSVNEEISNHELIDILCKHIKCSKDEIEHYIKFISAAQTNGMLRVADFYSSIGLEYQPNAQENDYEEEYYEDIAKESNASDSKKIIETEIKPTSIDTETHSQKQEHNEKKEEEKKTIATHNEEHSEAPTATKESDIKHSGIDDAKPIIKQEEQIPHEKSEQEKKGQNHSIEEKKTEEIKSEQVENTAHKEITKEESGNIENTQQQHITAMDTKKEESIKEEHKSVIETNKKEEKTKEQQESKQENKIESHTEEKEKEHTKHMDNDKENKEHKEETEIKNMLHNDITHQETKEHKENNKAKEIHEVHIPESNEAKKEEKGKEQTKEAEKEKEKEKEEQQPKETENKKEECKKTETKQENNNQENSKHEENKTPIDSSVQFSQIHNKQQESIKESIPENIVSTDKEVTQSKQSHNTKQMPDDETKPKVKQIQLPIDSQLMSSESQKPEDKVSTLQEAREK